MNLAVMINDQNQMISLTVGVTVKQWQQLPSGNQETYW